MLLSLLVADEVTLDPATGKPTARGIFFDVAGPCLLSFDVLLVITEVRQPTPVVVEVLRPDDTPVHRSALPVTAADPLAVHGNVARFRPCRSTGRGRGTSGPVRARPSGRVYPCGRPAGRRWDNSTAGLTARCYSAPGVIQYPMPALARLKAGPPLFTTSRRPP